MVHPSINAHAPVDKHRGRHVHAPHAVVLGGELDGLRGGVPAVPALRDGEPRVEGLRTHPNGLGQLNQLGVDLNARGRMAAMG